MTPHELNMGGGIGFGSGPISSEPNVKELTYEGAGLNVPFVRAA